jgi:hypothetical protein
VGGRGPSQAHLRWAPKVLSEERRVKGMPCTGSKRKPHVTAVEYQCKSARGRGFLCDGRHLRSEASFDLHGRTARLALAAGSMGSFAKAGRPSSPKRQRCQRLDSRGSDGRTGRITNLRGSAKANQASVKRQVHRSLGRGCKPDGQGRGASLEEKPVVRRGRGYSLSKKWEAEVGRTHRALSPSQVARRASGREG